MAICCICNKPYTGHGNNPQPVKTSGNCCDVCNKTIVLPRRVHDARIARIQRNADLLTADKQPHASAKLHALVGKAVEIKFFDESVERGILHVDTLATRMHIADAKDSDNVQIIGYYIDRGARGYLHFKKSHVITISEVQQ